MIHVLEIDSLILEFEGRSVLQDVYMRIESGRVSGLLGRNGAGKSCLLNVLYGVIKPKNSFIQLNKKHISGTFRSPEDMRFLPQGGFIPGEFRIKKVFDDFKLCFREFVRHFPEMQGNYHKKIKTLSGGERKLVEVYIVLVSKTKFCILDEPFSNLMPVYIEKILALIKRERENKGILVSDHRYRYIMDVCDDIYVVSNGKTYLTKSLDDLKSLGYIR